MYNLKLQINKMLFIIVKLLVMLVRPHWTYLRPYKQSFSEASLCFQFSVIHGNAAAEPTSLDRNNGMRMSYAIFHQASCGLSACVYS